MLPSVPWLSLAVWVPIVAGLAVLATGADRNARQARIIALIDAVLFYVFFEATLIPMYLVIGVWGGPNRVYAAVKFFLYTLLGSLLMLVAFLYLYNKSEATRA